jgi:mannitol-1-phosphate/altronate dehydrogenase
MRLIKNKSQSDIKAWVDRKALIHYLGHAIAAYYGYFMHPVAVYMHEILNDSEMYRFTRDIVHHSALKDGELMGIPGTEFNKL